MLTPETTRVWIVGAAGFLGSALRLECAAQGWPTVALDVDSPLVDVQGDAADPTTLQQALRHSTPTHIFCCTATHGGDAAAYRHAYVDVVRALKEAVPGARLVFCSSSSVYGRKDGSVVTEDSECLAEGERAEALLEAEREVLRARGCVARLTTLFDEKRCELLRRFLAGEPKLPGPPERILQYLHRQDAVRALLLLAELPSGVYNVAAHPIAKHEVYELLERSFDKKASRETSAPGKRGCCHQYVVTSEDLQDVGWQPEKTLTHCIRALAGK